MESQSIHVWVYDKNQNKRRQLTLTLPTTTRDRRKTLRATFANLFHHMRATIYSMQCYL
jgi:hypothetical protein